MTARCSIWRAVPAPSSSATTKRRAAAAAGAEVLVATSKVLILCLFRRRGGLCLVCVVFLCAVLCAVLRAVLFCALVCFVSFVRCFILVVFLPSQELIMLSTYHYQILAILKMLGP